MATNNFCHDAKMVMWSESGASPNYHLKRQNEQLKDQIWKVHARRTPARANLLPVALPRRAELGDRFRGIASRAGGENGLELAAESRGVI